MFAFAQKRIYEIEKLVKKIAKSEKKVDQQRVTKLNNEAAGKNVAEI
jgi:hypothetical protein